MVRTEQDRAVAIDINSLSDVKRVISRRRMVGQRPIINCRVNRQADLPHLSSTRAKDVAVVIDRPVYKPRIAIDKLGRPRESDLAITAENQPPIHSGQGGGDVAPLSPSGPSDDSVWC